jgi:hypothetical protein
MSPVGASTLLVLALVVLLCPRLWALGALAAGALYLTMGQYVDVLGANLYPIRILAYTAFARVVLRGELKAAALNRIDVALLLAFTYRTSVFLLNANGDGVGAIALWLDVVCAYFGCRGLVLSVADIQWLLRFMVVLLVPYACTVAWESQTGVNLFSIVGGIEQHDSRGDRPRCIGTFGHATLLGTFGASFFPLYVAAWMARSDRIWPVLGMSLCLALVYFANSGGALTLVAIGLVGWLLWPLRSHTRTIRLAAIIALVVLALLMQAPVWYLPAKVSALTGGDGWHRSYLMDVALHHLGDWWLAGMPILETRHWFSYTVASGSADLINYYLDFGLAGGAVAVALLCMLIVRAFQAIGNELAVASSRPQSMQSTLMRWGLGVVLSQHVFNWLGLVYFDQYFVFCFMQLAAISACSSPVKQAQTEQALDAQQSANALQQGRVPS